MLQEHPLAVTFLLVLGAIVASVTLSRIESSDRAQALEPVPCKAHCCEELDSMFWCELNDSAAGGEDNLGQLNLQQAFGSASLGNGDCSIVPIGQLRQFPRDQIVALVDRLGHKWFFCGDIHSNKAASILRHGSGEVVVTTQDFEDHIFALVSSNSPTRVDLWHLSIDQSIGMSPAIQVIYLGSGDCPERSNLIQVTLRNLKEVPLTINKVIGSCGCIEVDPPGGIELSHHQETVIEISVDTNITSIRTVDVIVDYGVSDSSLHGPKHIRSTIVIVPPMQQKQALMSSSS